MLTFNYRSAAADVLFSHLIDVLRHLLAPYGPVRNGRACATGEYEYKIPFEIRLHAGNALLSEKLLVMMARLTSLGN